MSSPRRDPAARPIWILGLVLGLVTLIVTIDLMTPRGVAIGAAYVCPVLVAVASPRRTLPLEVALLTTVLTVLNYFWSPPFTSAPWVVIANRALSVGMIWFVALLSLERRSVGAALRHAEARSAAVVDAAIDGILLVDGQGQVQGANAAAERLFRGAERDLVGKRIAALVPSWGPSGPPVAQGVIEEVWARRCDGGTFPARLAVGQAWLEAGPFFVVAVHDTTEARSRAQVLGLLATNLPIFLARVDAQGRLVEQVGQALSQNGLAAEAVLGALRAQLDQARAGEPVHHLTRHDADGRTCWLEHWLVHDAVREPDVVWFCLDVSERRRVEQRIDQAARLAALGELAGNIAHEINNPIGIISAKVRLLLTGAEPLGDKTRVELGKVTAQCDRVANLTRKLLNYVRPGDHTRQPVDVREPLRRALGLVGTKAARQGIQLAEALDAEVPAIQANAEELEQVFLNLLINAVDAMPGGGTLSVAAARDGARVRVSVEDTGAGMDPAVVRRIFEPFFTTKTDHGTGLGLHICHTIVQNHGGHIDVDSTPGRGSTFRVQLPVEAPDDGAVRQVEVAPGRARP